MDLDLIIKKNNAELEHLLKALPKSSNSDEIWDIGFALVEHYNDSRIEKTLWKALKSGEFEQYDFNFVLFYHLTIVFSNEDYFELAINKLLNAEHNIVIRIDCQTVIFDSKFPFKRKTINRLLRFLNKKKTENNLTEWQKEQIDTLIGYYEDQKVTLRIYSNFDKRMQELFKDIP